MKETKKKAAVIVAVHKPYQMPKDPLYVPLHVGAVRNRQADIIVAEGSKADTRWDAAFEKDDTGENISWLNPSFCELTGLYWAWKNLDADYLGLVHYRRHFSMSKKQDYFDSILKESELEPFFGKIRVFVPKKRKYYIETLYSHYAHTHYAVQLDASRQIIQEQFPDYISSYDKVVKQTYGYMFNMMIMEKELFDAYCSWLFAILFSLKKELGAKAIKEAVPEGQEDLPKDDQPILSDFQARFYGRVSEILFNVWLDQQIASRNLQKKEVMELGFINLEGENWGKKISSFLKAKYAGEKYEQSF